jgi:hypothetical protein
MRSTLATALLLASGAPLAWPRFFEVHAQDEAAVARSAKPRVALYGVFERQVTNTKTYSNPFDFRVVELKTQFTAPKDKSVRESQGRNMWFLIRTAGGSRSTCQTHRRLDPSSPSGSIQRLDWRKKVRMLLAVRAPS